MRKALLLAACCTALSAFAATAFAQQRSEEELVQYMQDENRLESVLYAAADTDPVLQYRLYPDRSKMVDRNAAIYYHRAAQRSLDIQSRIQANNRDSRLAPMPSYDSEGTYETWVTGPLADIPVEDMKAWIDMHEEVFVELKRARMSAHCNWGTMPHATEDINWINITLTEVQQMRAIVRMLAIKTRLAMHAGDFAEATHHMATGYKIANDLGQAESLVSNLVGITCAGLINQQIRLLQQLPGAPSLYWPLQDLPNPIADVSGATSAELKQLIQNDLTGVVKDPANANLTAAGWHHALHNQAAITFDGMTPMPASQNWVLDLLIVRGYPTAKQSLLDSGMAPEKVEQMPVIQVVAIQQERVIQSIADKLNSAGSLPYSQRLERVKKIDEDIVNSSFGVALTSDSVLLPSFTFYMPAIQQVYHAEARSVREIACLKTIEAIRVHAASTGSLPSSLMDIKDVPVPTNPATNEPFAYELSDRGVAELKEFGFQPQTWRLYKLQLAK